MKLFKFISILIEPGGVIKGKKSRKKSLNVWIEINSAAQLLLNSNRN